MVNRMVENKCVDCGEQVINIKKVRCDNCEKEQRKKHLSNIEIISKYKRSRAKIKQNTEGIIMTITDELNKFYSLKERFIFNSENRFLLDSKISVLESFREKLIQDWKAIFGEDYDEEHDFNIDKFLRRITKNEYKRNS